jgi:anti-sigma factor RsiW
MSQNSNFSDSTDKQVSDASLDAALRDLHRNVLTQPLPEPMVQAAMRLQSVQRSQRRTRKWSAIAASMLLAFGVGWLSNAQWQMRAPAVGAGAELAARDFVRQAGLAFVVYQPEKRHPVEVLASEQDHLVQWLSKRLERPLQIPHLDAQGFMLVGGRLLPGDLGARAQFMFQNAEAQRVTLYLGAIDKGRAGEAAQTTQFRLETSEPVPSFYWADQGFGYALSGQVDRQTLMALADAVYQQLAGGTPAMPSPAGVGNVSPTPAAKP